MPLQIESAAEKKHTSLSVCDREKERKESALMVMRCVLLFHPVLYAPQGCRNDCIALLLMDFSSCSIPPAPLSTASHTISACFSTTNRSRATEGLAHDYGTQSSAHRRHLQLGVHLDIDIYRNAPQRCREASSWLEGGWHCHTVVTQMNVGR